MSERGENFVEIPQEKPLANGRVTSDRDIEEDLRKLQLN